MAGAGGGRATCRTPATPIPWLLKITRNEAIRLATRRRRRELAEVHLVADEPARGEAASDTAIERTLTRVATKQALSGLGPDERRLIRLRYVDDLTQGQVARALGVPEGTVKVRLHRVRARLRGVAGDLAAYPFRVKGKATQPVRLNLATSARQRGEQRSFCHTNAQSSR